MNLLNNQIKTDQKKWHVVYTRSRAEKKVHVELNHKNIENFLPVQKKLRQWKDRKKWVEMPLISCYCFVYISNKEYDDVLHTDNIVRFVTFEGKAAVIPDSDIDSIRKMLKQFDFDVTVTSENFQQGRKVEIVTGPMIGLQGELVEQRGKNKFIIRINQINRAFAVEVPANHITALPENSE